MTHGVRNHHVKWVGGYVGQRRGVMIGGICGMECDRIGSVYGHRGQTIDGRTYEWDKDVG